MKSVVLLSGGLDSTVALAAAFGETEVVLALTINYGQRAAVREIYAAEQISKHYGVRHQTLTLDFLREITKTALVNNNEPVPKLTADVLDNFDVTQRSASSVWVPNRNGVFINIAAAFCETLECSQIIVGFNAEEGTTFPDNTPEYMAAATHALSYSTQRGVKVSSPTVNLNKTQMVAIGKKLGVPFNLIWSCYHGDSVMCGQCESCQRLKRALRQTQMLDTVDFAL